MREIKKKNVFAPLQANGFLLFQNKDEKFL